MLVFLKCIYKECVKPNYKQNVPAILININVYFFKIQIPLNLYQIEVYYNKKTVV